jgi:DNA-binding response OmpR family regulator/two-component sensor histidine kinase
VDRLVALINDLLDISRIESGRIKLKIEVVDLKPVIHEVVVTMEPLLTGKRQTLSVEVAPDLPPARADRDRVVQILTNLVSNAHKYTPDEGAIEVVAGRQDGQLQVKVKDNGMGISADDVPKLFTRFFRVDNSLTRQIGGTGLGLSIVKSIVEMQGGKVAVDTAPGRGSTFSFTLPVAEQPAEAPSAPAPAPATATAPAIGKPSEPLPEAIPEQERAAVLVVDEKRDDAEQLVRLLQRAGYAADAVDGVEPALQHIATRRPELITVGVRVPGLAGSEAARRLAREPVSQDIPLLLLSIHDLIPAEQPAGPTLDQIETLRHVRQALGTSAHRRVLVIEDDESIRRLLAITLENNGFEAVEAPDGESGLELASKEQPGLVLLDLRLPGIDGLAVLERLKRAPETARIPVIAMTGSQGLVLGARARVMALGAADFVTKPFELESLVDEIRALIGAKEVDRADTSARR